MWKLGTGGLVARSGSTLDDTLSRARAQGLRDPVPRGLDPPATGASSTGVRAAARRSGPRGGSTPTRRGNCVHIRYPGLMRRRRARGDRRGRDTCSGTPPSRWIPPTRGIRDGGRKVLPADRDRELRSSPTSSWTAVRHGAVKGDARATTPNDFQMGRGTVWRMVMVIDEDGKMTKEAVCTPGRIRSRPARALVAELEREGLWTRSSPTSTRSARASAARGD